MLNNNATATMLQCVVFLPEVIKVSGLLEEVIRETKPSVGAKDITFYEDMRQKYESKGQEAERRRHGFSFGN